MTRDSGAHTGAATTAAAKRLPARYSTATTTTGTDGPARSLVDDVVEGHFDDQPDYVQAVLQRLCNDRFLSVEEQYRRASDVLAAARHEERRP